MRRALTLVALLSAALALVWPAGAAAHPLGNFTVNRYAGVEVSGGAVYVRYVVDLAEIPTFQIGDRVRRPAFTRELASRLSLTVDGRRAELRTLARRLTERTGAGGLPTLRLDVVYGAGPAGAVLELRDDALPGRIGWREITFSARDGARVLQSDVPATSTSDLLRVYPKQLLRSPLDVRLARASVAPGEGAGVAPVIDAAGPADDRGGGGFEALIERGDLSLRVVLVSLLVAAFWGAVHALTPGHGKALVAGYLIGTRGRPRDAVLLGLTVTVTHTAGVVGLGLVTLALSHFVVPERLYPWLTLAAGLLVVGVGASVLRARVRTGGWGHAHDHDHHRGHHHHHGHDDHHHDDHDHDHRHVHAPTRGGVLGIGIAAGLLPCPSALVVLLSAIALHRLGFGFALIGAFSLGLAATITGIGLVAVLARRVFGRLDLDGPLVRALPAVSALVIVGVGIVLTARALPDVI
jgi:ABC-type nickel/cobalt efflux system permease component RcnA